MVIKAQPDQEHVDEVVSALSWPAEAESRSSDNQDLLARQTAAVLGVNPDTMFDAALAARERALAEYAAQQEALT